MVASSTELARAGYLAERVNGHPEHVAEVVPELLALLESSRDPETLVLIIWGLGLVDTVEATLAILPFARHPTASVRLAAAQALPCSGHPRDVTQKVADALVELSSDSDDDVRDWATFGLGTQLDIDDRATRSTLAARLDDPVGDVRDEALVGLARRRDPRAVALVSVRLDKSTLGRLVFEAAAFLADARLLPALREWADALPEDAEITVAVEACDPDRQAQRIVGYQALLRTLQAGLDREAPGTTASLSCERLSNDVHLGLSTSDLVWNVDALLTACTVEQAARRVLDHMRR